MTPVTRAAIADAAVGKAGLLRIIQRDTEPDIPDAVGDDGAVLDAVYAGVASA
jgi:hypothetical protein